MIKKPFWIFSSSAFDFLGTTFSILGGLHSVQATCEGNIPIFYGAVFLEIVFYGGTSFLLSYFSFKKFRSKTL
jgi:hypothetical protein